MENSLWKMEQTFILRETAWEQSSWKNLSLTGLMDGWMSVFIHLLSQSFLACSFLPSFVHLLIHTLIYHSVRYPVIRRKHSTRAKQKKTKKKNAYNYIIGIKLYICVPSFYTENFLFIYARISYCFPHTHLSQASLWHLDLFRELARYDRCIGKEVGWPSSLPSLPNYS